MFNSKANRITKKGLEILKESIINNKYLKDIDLTGKFKIKKR
jgi:hypothetical protein